MGHKLSNTSKERLETCHPDLILITETAIKACPVDFGVAQGHRSVEQQYEYFLQGKSRIDGKTKKGKHNYNPSMAEDIYAYVNGKAVWGGASMIFVAAYFTATADRLYDEGKITHKIRWGGNWDIDGEILTDQSFDDQPHLELYKP